MYVATTRRTGRRAPKGERRKHLHWNCRIERECVWQKGREGGSKPRARIRSFCTRALGVHSSGGCTRQRTKGCFISGVTGLSSRIAPGIEPLRSCECGISQSDAYEARARSRSDRSWLPKENVYKMKLLQLFHSRYSQFTYASLSATLLSDAQYEAPVRERSLVSIVRILAATDT